MDNTRILEDRYLKAKIAYYEGNPFLSDSAFDTLEEELKKRGSKVIEQVGAKRKDFDFPHPSPMLSLAKIQMELDEEGNTNYMADSFSTWYRKRLSILKKNKSILLASPKFDGNAINIIYQGKNLSSVLTRGDGKFGKDITKRMSSIIPNNLKLVDLELNDTDVLEIRAEVVIPVKLFVKKYSHTFANARNYVAGVLGTDDPDMDKVSELIPIPLHFILNGKHIHPYHFLENNFYLGKGFETFYVDDYVGMIKYYEELRSEFEFQLDGVVISFPVEYRSILGHNDHDPEWAIAIKFLPEFATTSVENIDWTASKTGEIIPTLNLKPVFLDGSTISRVAGYNAGYVESKKLGPGALVSIAKSGDIIPEIQEVISESLDPDSVLPLKCPYCDADLEYDGIHLVCPNESCEGRIAKRLTVAVKVLDLDGIGDKTMEPFAKDFDNIYQVIMWVYEFGDTPQIERYGIKHGSRSQEIFVNAFKNIRSIPYWKVIQMLGFDNVGKKLSEQLAREYNGLDYNYSHLEKALVERMRSEEMVTHIKNIVSQLESLGIKIDKPKDDKSGKIGIVMTGSPKKFGYSTKKDFLDAHPDLFETTFSDPLCQYLVTDSLTSSSSKMKKAKSKNLKIVTYDESIFS